VRKSLVMAIVMFAALLAAACGSSSKTSSHASTSASTPSTSTPGATGSLEVTTATIKPYGVVLVNSSGRALYTFAPDKATKVTCTGACAKIWPPLMLTGGAKPKASGGVKASLLGSDPDPSGGRVVTYNGWPLYRYVTDTTPEVAHGQALNLYGGVWYLITPSGTKVKSKSKSASSSGGGYGP
jgi:predicted lipoprotein with Yx(FWY)xxD motif